MTYAMITRNIKLFFKDKGMLFTSLITPVILLVLYATFLKNIYTDSFRSAIPEGVPVSDTIINATVGGELISSLLAVCCVTVAFCSNFLSVQDKVSGAIQDFLIAPLKKYVLPVSYYIASFLSTLVICFLAFGACLFYLSSVGWYLSLQDVAFLSLDIALLTLFGTALSSIINVFLTTQGQISAVGTIVSAGYGFLCGAYMPISNFSSTLQTTLSYLPSTYGTSLVRNHALRGVFAQMEQEGFPLELIDGIKESIDCRLFFQDREVPLSNMYLCMGITVPVLILFYVIIYMLRERKRK